MKLGYEHIKQRFITYKNCFIQEYKECKALFFLVKKSFKQPLTIEEKRKVKAQTFDLLKVIPAFAVFLLPLGTLWLFLLIKLVPGILPSAFRTHTTTTKNRD